MKPDTRKPRDKDGENKPGESLRRRAEKRVGKTAGARPLAVKKEEMQKLIHELQVHQIELEIQNEELLRARDEVEAGLERYTELYDFAPVGYFTLDRTGTIRSVNLTGAGLVNKERSLLVDRKFHNFVSADCIPAFNGFLRRVFEQPEKKAGEMELTLKGNAPIVVQVQAHVTGSGKECFMAVTDITGRRRAEEAIRESEERYRTLAEASPDQIFIVGRDDTMKYVNTAALKLFRRPYDQVIGTPRKNLFPPEIADAQGILLNKIFETGEPAQTEENIQFGTQEFWIDTILVPLKDRTGNVTSVLGVARDITERKKAEEAMRTFSEDLERKVTERTSDLSDVNLKLITEITVRLDAEKNLTKLLGQKEVLLREVHHRVKNNLQIIASLLNLQSRYITDVQTLAAIRESQNRVKAMALVHEKLYQSADISKIDLGNYIRFLGHSLFQFFGTEGKGITLTMDIRDIFLTIDVAIPVGLIINELISNSLKYAFPGERNGEITIAVRREDHTFTILFKDNGVGIPEDFDWRDAKSLGLRLVTTLVEQLDGTIELDRSAGTAFTIIVKEKE